MDNKSIPYIAFESELARAERHVKRLCLLCALLIVLLVGTNVVWIVYENQFEDVVVTQEATADGESDIRIVNGNNNGR